MRSLFFFVGVGLVTIQFIKWAPLLMMGVACFVIASLWDVES